MGFKKLHSAFFLCLALFCLQACGKPSEQQAEPVPTEQVPNIDLTGKTDASQPKPDLVQILPTSQQTPPTGTEINMIQAAREGKLAVVIKYIENLSVRPFAQDEQGQTALIAAASMGHPDVVEYMIKATGKGANSYLNWGDKNGWSAIMHAAKAGSVESVTILRDAGANPNVYDNELKSPAFLAAEAWNAALLKALLEPRKNTVIPNPNVKNKQGETIATIAIKNNRRDFLELMKELGANFDEADSQGVTPLIYAVKLGSRESIEFLLGLGANINAINFAGDSPLILTIKSGNNAMMTYLLEKGADPNAHKNSMAAPLQILVDRENADPELTRLLISKGAKLQDPSIPTGNVISRALHKGNAKVLDELFKGGAKISDLETTTGNGLTQALSIGDSEMALLMLEKGARVNLVDENGLSPLAHALKTNSMELIKALLAKGADPNQEAKIKGASPLEIVIDSDNPEILELLIGSGLKVNFDTTLLKAITEGKEKIIPLLIKKGARPNIMNSYGQPAIWLATTKGKISAVKSLLEGGAVTNVADSQNKTTPLIVAAYRGYKEILKLLIDSKANLELSDKNGLTALAYAVTRGSPETVETLITAGANVNATDSRGNTILDIAFALSKNVSYYDKTKNLAFIIDILKKAGAKRNSESAPEQGGGAPTPAPQAQPENTQAPR